jgi:hypothetical protein
MTQNVQPAGSVLTNYGIVAWIVYVVLSGGGHWIGAALGALVVALAILAHEYRCYTVKILNCTVSSSLSEGARKGRFPRGKWPGGVPSQIPP